MDRVDPIIGINISEEERKPYYFYGFDNYPLRTPLPLMAIVYGAAGVALWSFPMIMLFGFKFNPYYLIFIFSVPLAMAIFGPRRIFAGRTLWGFISNRINFFISPPAWGDGYSLTNSQINNKVTYYTFSEIWVSRRSDLRLAFLSAQKNGGLKKKSEMSKKIAEERKNNKIKRKLEKKKAKLSAKRDKDNSKKSNKKNKNTKKLRHGGK